MLCSNVQRRPPVLATGIHRGAACQQCLQHGHVAASSSGVQRRAARVVDSVHLATTVQERCARLQLASARCKVQRRAPRGVTGVDRRLLCRHQQRRHVPARGSIVQRRQRRRCQRQRQLRARQAARQENRHYVRPGAARTTCAALGWRHSSRGSSGSGGSHGAKATRGGARRVNPEQRSARRAALGTRQRVVRESKHAWFCPRRRACARAAAAHGGSRFHTTKDSKDSKFKLS